MSKTTRRIFLKAWGLLGAAATVTAAGVGAFISACSGDASNNSSSSSSGGVGGYGYGYGRLDVEPDQRLARGGARIQSNVGRRG